MQDNGEPEAAAPGDRAWAGGELGGFNVNFGGRASLITLSHRGLWRDR